VTRTTFAQVQRSPSRHLQAFCCPASSLRLSDDPNVLDGKRGRFTTLRYLTEPSAALLLASGDENALAQGPSSPSCYLQAFCFPASSLRLSNGPHVLDGKRDHFTLQLYLTELSVSLLLAFSDENALTGDIDNFGNVSDQVDGRIVVKVCFPFRLCVAGGSRICHDMDQINGRIVVKVCFSFPFVTLPAA
jgi:hypothetical protein